MKRSSADAADAGRWFFVAIFNVSRYHWYQLAFVKGKSGTDKPLLIAVGMYRKHVAFSIFGSGGGRGMAYSYAVLDVQPRGKAYRAITISMVYHSRAHQRG
jgi:hypothetical protein